MFAFPRPDTKYDSSLLMDFVPVHKLVVSERFQNYCEDKENILKLINSNGDNSHPQYFYKQCDAINGNKQRFHDQSQTTTHTSESTKLLSCDCGQSDNSTHHQADKQ